MATVAAGSCALVQLAETTQRQASSPWRKGLLRPGSQGRRSRVTWSAYHQKSKDGTHAAAVGQEELLHLGACRFQEAGDRPRVHLEMQKTAQELPVTSRPGLAGPRDPRPSAKAHLGTLQVEAHQSRARGGQQAKGLGGHPAAVGEAQGGQVRAGGGQSLQRQAGRGGSAPSTPSQEEGRNPRPRGSPAAWPGPGSSSG